MDHSVDITGFLLAFASALLAAKLLGELSERIGQPSVLGELMAGVLLGPSVLGLVPLSVGFSLLAGIGIVLLLFEVGLETDLEDLLRVGGPAMAVAVGGMALPFLGGYWLTRAIGYGPLTAVFVGAALTATSISMTARLLSELNVLKSREGQIILAAAVADDVLGLVVLAVVSRIAERESVDWHTVGRAGLLSVGFLVLAIAVGIPLGRRLIGVVGRANVRGVLGAASVGFALLLAVAARRAGSAEIVGGFATGLVLARTNRRHDIDRALKPVVDIFAPLFFVSVGAQVHVALLNPFKPANRHVLGLALGLAAVGFLGKFLAGFLAGRQVRHAFIGVGMVPRGELDLIVASIGRATGALPEDVFTAVVLAVFATTFLAPPLLKRLSPAQPVAGRVSRVEA